MSSTTHSFEASTSAILLGQTTAQQNSKYKAYASAVDKALKSFENTTEWADLIAALGKLGKVFSSHAKTFNDIPNSLTVSKRLSQCLHPALPSGVHIKALETYRQVFLILGRTQNLARFLFLYAAGLFPLMDHCGIKVKSELLAIIEQFLIPLGPDLRAALPGLITALLLALEEGTEFYGRAFALLDQLVEKVGTDAFYICFWQAVSGNPSARLPALIFVNAKIEKRKNSSGDLLASICGGGQASDHMLRALCAVAEDTGTPLIQRHLLDFLCTTIPINSEWVPRQDLVQLLRRCLFVVLRRDMSLNRRLYQWLLNRTNDMAFTGLPVNGVEDSMDMAFFKKNTLPLIKAAIRDYLSTVVIEVPPPSTGAILPVRSTTSTLTKNYSQLQFPEVRVCRLLHYMLDRPELGQLVLEECLPDLLNTACTRDATLMKELQRECEEIDPGFCHLWNCADLELSEQEQARRIDEIRKNFNALLNSLEPSFLWTFFERLFAEINKLEYADRDSVDFSLQECEEENSLNEQEDEQYKKKQLRNVFPLMILYCIKNVQLDSSEGDIRNRHMPMLLRHILTGIDVVQNAAFALDNLVALVVVCRHLLAEITQNNVSVVFESFHEAAAATNSTETSPSKKNVKCNKELTEEQKLVELSLEACLTLLSSICQWYTESREREKIGLLAAVSTLVWDFADFPFYSLQPLAALSTSDPQSPCRSLTDSVNNLKWLHSLTSLIDPNSWRTNGDHFDFDIRAKLFDLLLYLCVRSGSMIEQHAAVFGRALSQQRTLSSSNEKDNNKKTTTTVLLKPFLSQANLNQIENSELFQKSSSVLWERFSENTELPRLHTVALLLLRLHSRRINDSSSEVEDIIVGELTSSTKALSGEAARKFRDLWVFCRSSQIEEVYGGIPLKPMNRVVMVLLGFIADDSFGTEQVELRALAYSWFQDCARNNDLHKILQMLTLMLLNPTTARVSIQFVQMRQRITPEQLPSLPEAANCVSLTTFTGKQTFHHVCKDVDGQKQRSEAANIFAAPPKQSGNSWSDYSYINCSPKQPWVSELNRQLLLPSNATTSSCYQQQIEGITKPEDSATADQTMSCQKKSQHNRTLSDIPQFDNDVESIDSFSLDASLDQDVLDVMQLLVDTVCEQYELREENEDEIPEVDKTITKSEQSNKAEDDHPNLDEVFKKENKSHVRNRYISSAQEADEISVVGSLITPAATSAALPRISAYSGSGGDTIKRIRTGHRRQDSLQESIFSTGTQELRLFDPAELPNSTCPGDYKQPLLDETFSHMLFYAESPGMVDLGRAEKLFRTIDTLLKGGLGRQIVSCMLFTNMSTMTAGTGFGRTNDGRSSICGGAAAAVSQQLMEFMARHYRHIQGEGFWDKATQNDGNTEGNDMNEGKTQQQQRNSTLFEIFSTVILYFFRSYYLNSPTNYVSEADLALAWKCKIAALDCFTELLRILDGIVRDASSKEFATFVQHIYRQTKTQKVVLTLMLAAVPTPAQKGWKMPLTMDIAEFNNGSQKSSHFRDLIYAYHRALLNLASSLVILEYSLLIGIRYFSSHNSQGVVPPNFGQTHQITENQINYNSSQTRSTIREARYSVVELRLFLGVILNALKRCPERHELWLEFLIGILPYLDRALATFVVHVTEQICRNLYVCVFNINNANAELLSSPLSAVQAMAASFLEHPKSPMQFVDYRFMPPSSKNNSEDISPVDSPRITIKYPANYMLNLIESLMSILHFSMLDNNLSFLVSPQMVAKNTATAFTPYAGQITSGPATTTSPNRHSMLSTHSSTSGAGGGTFSSSNMTSVVGSAISVIPGTGLINNLFGRVFTSGDSSNSTNVARSENVGKTAEWLDAQRELIKRLPGVLAILSDVWSYIGGKDTIEFTKSPTTFGTYKALTSLILEIVNSIAKKHKNMIISAFGIVWIFRSSAPHSDHPLAKGNDQSQCNFIYSPQQVSIAKFALHLKALSLNSIIVSISETLKEISNKAKAGVSDKAYNYSLEVSLLEFLHECTRQLSVAELKESWNALNILFNETPLTQLPARAAFIEFTILVDFVRRCGTQTILEDRYIGKAILDVCQKLVEAVNSIVGWQLESTTWLKRTLVVRQDAATQKTMSDLSPVLDQKGIAASSMTMSSTSALPSSEANSIRGSTISLSGIPPSRLSSALDIHPSNSTSMVDGRKQMASSSLRSSIKDSSVGGRKDPSDSTQAIFLFAENLTELIDSVTKSEEKEKMLPLIQAVWNNTLPYLKSKSAKNVRSFLASSQLLASMSSFNYMRTVWKKNAMELLWDNSFFKMDMHALRQWLIVIDNLMTNDKTSFKELLARITTSTSTTLSTLITSKEQEYEMRAQYLKRLAFVILSSELDQYNGQLNEIQERLTENLRLCQAPVIHTQVFACYRVLLVRMSPSSFVSIWPSMITELVQVLAQIEQHLCNITNNTSLDEQRSAKDEQSMQLFLAGCKLLETLCILPSGYVSQFQMCRWTFVAPMNARTMSELFVPFAVKLDQLLSTKYGHLTNEDLELRTVSLFNVKTLTSLQELQPLFHVLAQQNRHLMVGTNDGQSQQLHNGQMSPPPTDNGSPRHDNDSNKFYTEEPLDGSLPLKKAVARVEHSLYVDFAEHWQL